MAERDRQRGETAVGVHEAVEQCALVARLPRDVAQRRRGSLAGFGWRLGERRAGVAAYNHSLKRH